MLRAFQLCVSVLAAGVLCALCAWAGGALEPARAAPGPRTSELGNYPRPEDRPEIPVGDAIDAAGQPVQLSLFTTADRPEQVLSWYSAQFEQRGLLPVGAAEGSMAHVTAYDPDDGLQRFVTALGQGKNETLVLLGVLNPRRAPRLTGSSKGAPVPIPPEQRGYFGYGSRDGTTQAFSAQFLTKLAPADVLAFYRRELAGFQERGEAGGLVTFAKGGVIVSVATQALEEKGGSAVFVNRTEGAP